MKMKIRPIIAATCFIALGAASWTIASTSSDNDDLPIIRAMMQHHNEMLSRISQDLSLTDTQKRQVGSIINDERTIIDPNISQLHHNIKALRDLSEKDTVDQTECHNLADSTAGNVITMVVELQRTKSKIYTVLNQNQRNKADEHIAMIMTKLDNHLNNVPRNHQRMFTMISNRLNLTGAQKQKIEQIIQVKQGSMHASVKDIVENWKSLQTLTKGGVFNESAVTSHAQRLRDPIESLIENSIVTKNEIMQVLTPQQKSEAKQIHNSIQRKIAERIMSWHNNINGETSDDLF